MADVDAVVVGAGVIGLAVARRLATAGLSTIIVEGDAVIGNGTSSRNSEVIHAGLYYGATPRKRAMCIAGREHLYAYAQTRGVAHRRIGKLIVAFEAAELATLSRIMDDARAAGVDDLVALTGADARALEPELRCAGALLSPSTGIIDSHGLMQALLADAEDAGAVLACRTRVSGLVPGRGGWTVMVDGAPALTATRIVNAAGLGATALAAATEGLEHVPTLRYARGHYFTYAGRVPFSRLIYPVPVPGGLGTHLTLDLAGNARFGPDVEWIDTIDYRVDPARGDSFRAAAARIWPALDPSRIAPGYAGIRPKLGGPGDPAADFAIEGPAEHGLAGLVNLYGIESPGLTASLAIADDVALRIA